MKNAAKYAWSFSRNSSFLRGLFYYAAPCILTTSRDRWSMTVDKNYVAVYKPIFLTITPAPFDYHINRLEVLSETQAYLLV